MTSNEATATTYLAVGIAVLAVVLGVVYVLLSRRIKNKPPVSVVQPAQEAVPRADRTAMGRMNRRAQAQATAAQQAELPEQHAAGSDEEDADDALDESALKRMGTKKAEKLRRKEEERRYKEMQQAQREDARKRESLRDEERKRRKDEEAFQEKLEADAEKRRLAERARQDEEEYQRLRQEIVVEQAGTEQKSAAEVRELLARMADYILAYKVVTLEELSSEFHIRTQDAVRWLKELDSTGKITGVMDDRGKYVHITDDEMQQVADFMLQRGRVSRSELASMSNKLIDLKGQRRQVSASDVFADISADHPHPDGQQS